MKTSGLLILTLLGSAACAPVYAPAALNVPMLNGLHDAHVNAQYGNEGLQLNGAYAATNHLALRVSAQRYEKLNDSSAGTGLRQVMGTVGAGYFWAPRIGHGSRSSLNFDLGGGHVDGTFNVGGSEIDRARGPFLRAAAQVDTAYQFDYFAIGLAGRVTYLSQFYEPGTTLVHGVAGHYVFAEPAIVVRAGPPAFHVEGQLGLSIPFVASNWFGLINPFIASVGLGSNF